MPIRMKHTFLCCCCLALALAGCKNEDTTKSQKDPINESELVTDDPNNNMLYVAALTGVNLREGAGTSGKVIQLVPYMTALTLLEQNVKKETIDEFEGSWVKVALADGTEGYIFDSFTLPILPPATNPSPGIEGYFQDNLIPLGNKEAVRLLYDERIEGYKTIKVPLGKVKVEEESDLFEIKQEYAGGYYLSEQIGYESQAIIGFFPGLSLQQGFILTRALMPKFGYDNCFLQLGSMKFPKEDNVIQINAECSYQLTIEKKAGVISKISFLSSDFAYYGLDLTLINNGVEVKTLYAL